jgi:hypothetical protein
MAKRKPSPSRLAGTPAMTAVASKSILPQALMWILSIQLRGRSISAAMLCRTLGEK